MGIVGAEEDRDLTSGERVGGEGEGWRREMQVGWWEAATNRSVLTLSRFADIDDAADITALVNSSQGQPRVKADKVAKDLEGGTGNRWVVLETSYPDEVLIACARLEVDGKEKVCVINSFAVGREFQGKGAGVSLMKKVETTVRGMSCRTSTLRIGHWEEEAIKWAETLGYKQGGGSLWPEERMGEVGEEALSAMKEKGVLPMILDMRKVLDGEKKKEAPSKEASSSKDVGIGGMLDGLGGDLDITKGVMGILNALPDEEGGKKEEGVKAVEVTTRKGGGGDENLEDLVGDLLKALKTDNGRAEFARLSKKEEVLEGIIGE